MAWVVAIAVATVFYLGGPSLAVVAPIVTLGLWPGAGVGVLLLWLYIAIVVTGPDPREPFRG